MPIINIITYTSIGLSLALLLPIGIILGIVFAVKASDQDDPILKKKDKKRMWWSFFCPLVIVAFLVIFSGLINIIYSTFK